MSLAASWRRSSSTGEGAATRGTLRGYTPETPWEWGVVQDRLLKPHGAKALSGTGAGSETCVDAGSRPPAPALVVQKRRVAPQLDRGATLRLLGPPQLR